MAIALARASIRTAEWLLSDDFNAICCSEEWDGKGDFDELVVVEFNDVVIGMVELDAVGELFTWGNRVGPTHTCSFLNRMLCNDAWIS